MIDSVKEINSVHWQSGQVESTPGRVVRDGICEQMWRFWAEVSMISRDWPWQDQRPTRKHLWQENLGSAKLYWKGLWGQTTVREGKGIHYEANMNETMEPRKRWQGIKIVEQYCDDAVFFWAGGGAGKIVKFSTVKVPLFPFHTVVFVRRPLSPATFKRRKIKLHFLEGVIYVSLELLDIDLYVLYT